MRAWRGSCCVLAVSGGAASGSRYPEIRGRGRVRVHARQRSVRELSRRVGVRGDRKREQLDWGRRGGRRQLHRLQELPARPVRDAGVPRHRISTSAYTRAWEDPELPLTPSPAVTPFAQVLFGGSHMSGGTEFDGALNTGLTLSAWQGRRRSRRAEDRHSTRGRLQGHSYDRDTTTRVARSCGRGLQVRHAVDRAADPDALQQPPKKVDYGMSR